jgi:hypothetical protein
MTVGSIISSAAVSFVGAKLPPSVVNTWGQAVRNFGRELLLGIAGTAIQKLDPNEEAWTWADLGKAVVGAAASTGGNYTANKSVRGERLDLKNKQEKFESAYGKKGQAQEMATKAFDRWNEELAGRVDAKVSAISAGVAVDLPKPANSPVSDGVYIEGAAVGKGWVDEGSIISSSRGTGEVYRNVKTGETRTVWAP